MRKCKYRITPVQSGYDFEKRINGEWVLTSHHKALSQAQEAFRDAEPNHLTTINMRLHLLEMGKYKETDGKFSQN